MNRLLICPSRKFDFPHIFNYKILKSKMFLYLIQHLPKLLKGYSTSIYHHSIFDQIIISLLSTLPIPRYSVGKINFHKECNGFSMIDNFHFNILRYPSKLFIWYRHLVNPLMSGYLIYVQVRTSQNLCYVCLKEVMKGLRSDEKQIPNKKRGFLRY